MWSLKLEGAGGPVENPRVRTGVHRTLSNTNRRGSKAGSSGGKRVANHGAIVPLIYSAFFYLSAEKTILTPHRLYYELRTCVRVCVCACVFYVVFNTLSAISRRWLLLAWDAIALGFWVLLIMILILPQTQTRMHHPLWTWLHPDTGSTNSGFIPLMVSV